MSQYNNLYTAQDSAIVFIDLQPQMNFGMANADRATMVYHAHRSAKIPQFHPKQAG
jgi:hypothetical protein